MTFLEFIRLASSHFKLMFLSGLVAAGALWWVTKGEKKSFSSHTLINTGLVSGYNLENSGGSKVDFAYTNNEIENLISLATSYETMEELSMRLIAKYTILTAPHSEWVTTENWEQLNSPMMNQVRTLVLVPGDADKTYQNILKYKQENQENAVQSLMYSEDPFFGVDQLLNIKVTREGKSDMLRFQYTTADPAVCRQTLVLLTTIFEEKHHRMKAVQSTDVLEFFRNATSESKTDLNSREDGLLQFMAANRIINYYEQTRFIAAKKEDLDELYFKELMRQAGADSSLVRIESELKKHVNLSEINQKLAAHRVELTEIETRIAETEIFNADTVQTETPAIRSMKKRAQDLRNDLQTGARATFAVNRTPEGVEVKDLLTQWLNQVLDNEQSMARIGVFQVRKREFDAIYAKFAPWGSRLKRMEREIDVAERAYLENLHSYNQARLHQFNMMLASNLTIVDPPFMPSKPSPSKRIAFIIVAFLAGFFLTLGAAVAMEMLDNSLQSPQRAQEQTGLEFGGIFPKFPETQGKKMKIDYESIRKSAMVQFLQNIKIDLKNNILPGKQPKRLLFISTFKGEGKSFVAQETAAVLRKTGDRVALLTPNAIAENEAHADTFSYQPSPRFFETKSEVELISDTEFDPAQFHYLLLELPALLSDTYPVELIGQYDMSVMVARANRAWKAADDIALSNFKKSASAPPKLFLNATRIDRLEACIGEIPRKRSSLRIWMKKAILLDFSNKKAI